MTKQEKIMKNQAGNTVMDRIMQGVAAFAVIALAWREVLRHVKATEPISFGLAALVVGFLAYLVLAPLFRTK